MAMINGNDKSILEFLQSRALEGRARFHMPGHKGRALTGKFWDDLFKIDLTELPDTDDLHEPEGMIARSQERAAALWGAKRSFYLVGSSTAGILAGVLACVGDAGGGRINAHADAQGEGNKSKKTVIIARNCHKSVYSACDIARARKSFIMPDIDPESGIFLSIRPEQVGEAIEREKGRAALVVITSPTYDGVISDVSGIARVCRKAGVPLMIDEAHGAHLGLGSTCGGEAVFPGGAVRAGADIVIQSLHKTLPSLTQTGIAHFCSEDKELEGRFASMLARVQSSSPSYVLMASMDACVRLMESRGAELLRAWRDNCEYAAEEIAKIKNVRLFRPHSGAFGIDQSKLCLITPDAGIYAEKLRKAGIDCEMALGRELLLYTGLGTEKEDIDRAIEALLRLDTENIAELPHVPFPLKLPRRGRVRPDNAISEAGLASPEAVLRSIGGVSTVYAWAYPPGIPLICPGERLDRALAIWLAAFLASGRGRLHFA
ncbi:MAG: hypothetical protein IKH41_01550 [Clostridia bacterium]|nr:hypothetical protein [Clostridia bacterium]